MMVERTVLGGTDYSRPAALSRRPSTFPTPPVLFGFPHSRDILMPSGGDYARRDDPNVAVEGLTGGQVKFQEKFSLRFLRISLVVVGGFSGYTGIAVWLVAGTVVYAVASRMIYNLIFLRRRAKP